MLGNFTKSPHVTINSMEELKVGMDTSIFLNRLAGSDADKLAMTATPPHPAPDLFLAMKELHAAFSKVFTPIYVWDGDPPWLKKKCRDSRKERREKAGKEWFELRKKVRILDANAPPFSYE